MLTCPIVSHWIDRQIDHDRSRWCFRYVMSIMIQAPVSIRFNRITDIEQKKINVLHFGVSRLSLHRKEDLCSGPLKILWQFHSHAKHGTWYWQWSAFCSLPPSADAHQLLSLFGLRSIENQDTERTESSFCRIHLPLQPVSNRRTGLNQEKTRSNFNIIPHRLENQKHVSNHQKRYPARWTKANPRASRASSGCGDGGNSTCGHIFCDRLFASHYNHSLLTFVQTHAFLTRFPNSLGTVVSSLCRIWNKGYLSQWVILAATKDVSKKFCPSLHLKLTERIFFYGPREMGKQLS